MKHHHIWGVVIVIVAYIVGARYPKLAKKVGVA
jgi:hypothetical protein